MILSFYILAICAVISAVMVISRPNPMHSALWLLVTLVSMAGIYLQLNAEFVAAIQVIIYAGGVLVLYIFVIMLVDLSKEAALKAVFHGRTQIVLACTMTALVLGTVLFSGLSEVDPVIFQEAVGTGTTDTTRLLAQELFTTYLYPFEVASILLLVAMIGAVTLTRRPTAVPESEGGSES